MAPDLRPDSVAMSDMSTASTEIQAFDVKQLYHGTIADINFRGVSDGPSVTMKQNLTVSDILLKGPASIMGTEQPQVRWIHLPSNNMAWVEDLMAVLGMEKIASDNSEDIDHSYLDLRSGILRDAVWRNVFHGRNSNSIHSRFLAPLASRYRSIQAEDPASDDAGDKWQDANVLALYMPYLHWETYNSWKHRQRHIKRIKDTAALGKECDCQFEVITHKDEVFKDRESALLHQCLRAANPLHDRRSLDQSYFYNLRQVGYKDEDQIIGQHTWNKADLTMAHRKMMMTDQLWMWVIDNSTIVTAFPENDTVLETNTSVAEVLFANLRENVQQGSVKSVQGLISLIVDSCTGVFHRSDINPDIAFFEFFASEIGEARSEVEQIMREFQQISNSVENLWFSTVVTWEQMSRKLDRIFSIEREINLVTWIATIISDLDKIDFVYHQQEDTLRELIQCSKFNRNFNELCETIGRRRSAWAGMAETAKATRESLRSLLDLKQRQASVSEARTIRGQIELSAKQGRSIMLLTVFTVLFLPVSVMATIFGMNAREFVGEDGGKVAFKTIIAIALPVTLMLVVSALCFAFGKEAEAAIISILSFFREKIGSSGKWRKGKVSASGVAIETG